MESQGLRLTPQRQAVLAALEASTDHPTAAEVHERVRKVHPGIGAATVYRSLARLVDSGQALELSLPHGSGTAAARYDANTTRHDHLVCDRCGRAVDVDCPVPAANVSAVAARSGFRITGHELHLRGLCPSCQHVPSS